MTAKEARAIVVNKYDDGNLVEVKLDMSLSDGTHIFKCKLKEPKTDPLGNVSDEFTIWVDKEGRKLVEPE